MSGPRLRSIELRQRRRWSFGNSTFDEANWSLTVAGRRVAVESKPLRLLRELLLGAGNVISKDELLDAIWPDVEVVEASLPTAVAKLRRALGDDRRKVPIVATVPRIGYRLTVPVEVEDLSSNSPGSPTHVRTEVPNVSLASSGQQAAFFSRTQGVAAATLLIAVAAIAVAVAPPKIVTATEAAPPFTQRDAATALRKLDLAAIEALLSTGWDPATPFDTDDNGALNILLNVCEWDPAHDQRQMLLMARTLIDGGARLDHRNRWGDTAYSIAKAKRYCGPHHPATRMIRTLCYAGYRPLGDRCLASYELARREQLGGA